VRTSPLLKMNRPPASQHVTVGRPSRLRVTSPLLQTDSCATTRPSTSAVPRIFGYLSYFGRYSCVSCLVKSARYMNPNTNRGLSPGAQRLLACALAQPGVSRRLSTTDHASTSHISQVLAAFLSSHAHEPNAAGGGGRHPAASDALLVVQGNDLWDRGGG
jgi:hypothetical protein